MFKASVGMFTSLVIKLSEVSCLKRRFEFSQFDKLKVKRGFRFKASVRMFTSLIKKLCEVSCSKRRFASSPV